MCSRLPLENLVLSLLPHPPFFNSIANTKFMAVRRNSEDGIVCFKMKNIGKFQILYIQDYRQVCKSEGGCMLLSAYMLKRDTYHTPPVKCMARCSFVCGLGMRLEHSRGVMTIRLAVM